jgi:tripeptidyl-peptidase I
VVKIAQAHYKTSDKMFIQIILVVALFGLLHASPSRMEPSAKVVGAKEWLMAKTDLPAQHLDLIFAVKLRNTDLLHEKLMNASLPSSENYGRHLSFNEMKAMTNPHVDTIESVVSFLKEFGIDRKKMRVSGGFIKVKVEVEVAEKMLSTKYYTYKHASTGDITLRCKEYFLPDTVAQHIDFVAPTIKFPRSFTTKAEQAVALSTPVSNTPDSLRALYGLGDATGGKSTARQAVTAFLHQYYLESDLQSFYQSYFPSLYGTPISVVVGPNGDKAGTEASLDVEYMTVMGAGVPTEFWSYDGRQPDNDQNEPFLDWLMDLSEDSNPPLVFSTSYGEDEDSVSLDYATRMNQEFQRNSLRGVTFLFASGDSGVGSCFGACTTYTPQYPSGSPYVTAVGATTDVPETGAGLSSGGFSNRWVRPSWQDDAVSAYFSTAASSLPDPSLYNATGRGFPDVSAQGTGFVVINNGITFPAVSGTSCSSPTFGGIVAMLVCFSIVCLSA